MGDSSCWTENSASSYKECHAVHTMYRADNALLLLWRLLSATCMRHILMEHPSQGRSHKHNAVYTCTKFGNDRDRMAGWATQSLSRFYFLFWAIVGIFLICTLVGLIATEAC